MTQFSDIGGSLVPGSQESRETIMSSMWICGKATGSWERV